MASSSSNKTSADLYGVEIVVDEKSHKKYKKGKFLGKGGFARCYELVDMDTNKVYAGKIVAKSLLTKSHQKEKMVQEIEIHRSLGHRHVVGFHGFFEDKDNIYILLELCRRRSLMELHKRRKTLTDPEVRYLLKQIMFAVQYLHDVKVIHRDLKLGNLFLNDDMEIKVGDFGLATRVEADGEKRRTLCGTPNYIAPEVLNKRGHSFEVDVWSIGCILYTLLVGKPPFETSSLKETYSRIKRNEYRIPNHVNPEARFLIHKLLDSNPSLRPNAVQILQHPFLSGGYCPTKLPVSCLTTVPHFKKAHDVSLIRKPLSEHNQVPQQPTVGEAVKPEMGGGAATPFTTAPQQDSPDWHLHDLLKQLTACLEANPSDKPAHDWDEAEDPACMPIFWVSKWVDYSDKYGIGYQLCDNSVGTLFNDCTRLLLSADGESMQYIMRDLTEEFYSFSSPPSVLNKKVTLLNYFHNYMSEHLLKAGGTAAAREVDEGVRLPYLRAWTRTRSAIVLHLSNGTIQINFFHDHTKVIICPLMQAVSYIDESKSFRTFRLKYVQKFGCSLELASRLRYAKNMVERLISKLQTDPHKQTAGGEICATPVETKA